MDVFVTGGTGFVGSNLVETLVRRGDRVTCLVRKTSDLGSLAGIKTNLVTGDINDPASFREAVRGAHVVYHLAGVIKARNREEYLHVNRHGTRCLLQAIADSNSPLTRFVYISSLAAAGPARGTKALVEEDEPHPVSWYGESKLLAEKEVLQFSHLFPVTILRPSAVYGPRDRETLMAFRMINRGCLFTPGRFTRRFSLIHVRDLVSACIQAAQSQKTGSGAVYFISHPETCTWEDIGRTIARELGKKYRHISFPQELAVAVGLAGDMWTKITGRPATLNSQKVKELLQPSWVCDPSRAQAELGFSPVVDLRKGLHETVAWYRKEGWL